MAPEYKTLESQDSVYGIQHNNVNDVENNERMTWNKRDSFEYV
jgi:hypothetical protein